MDKLKPDSHPDIGLNCLTPINRDFEKLKLCFLIEKYTQTDYIPPFKFYLTFQNPPLGAIFLSNVKLIEDTDIFTHKVYVLEQTFYVVRNF